MSTLPHNNNSILLNTKNNSTSKPALISVSNEQIIIGGEGYKIKDIIIGGYIS